MPRSFTSILLHVVFSTYERQPLITKELSPDLHAYIGGITRGLHATAIRVGGAADHVHILAGIPPTLAVAEYVNKVKSNSSKWIHETRMRPLFGWQRGYGAFSVSRSGAEAVARYIAGQDEHHHLVSFREEFLRLLQEAGIDYDERYVFD